MSTLHPIYTLWHKTSLCLGLILSITCTLSGQSYYYNTQQFGLHSTLLGGAVTSGNHDLSMAYYNPGALYLADSKVDISLIRPSYRRFGIGEFFGESAVDNDFDFGLTPNLASFKISLSPKINLVIITIQKDAWDNNIQTRSDFNSSRRVASQSFEYKFKGDDYWMGTGGSYRINDQVSVGLSHFFSHASYNFNSSINSLLDDGELGEQDVFFSEFINSDHGNLISMVTKAGLHINLPETSLGLVIKTPNYLSQFNGGSYEREFISLEGDNQNIQNVLNFSVDPVIKTPWEFSFGFSRRIQSNSKFWSSIFIYPALKEYTIAELIDERGNVIEWVNAHQSVVNLSLGYSMYVNSTVEITSSFRTNFSSYEPLVTDATKVQTNLLNSDQYHIALGVNLTVDESELTFGLDWGFAGDSNSDLFANYPNIDRLSRSQSDFSSNSFTFLLTYGFFSKKRIQTYSESAQ